MWHHETVWGLSEASEGGTHEANQQGRRRPPGIKRKEREEEDIVAKSIRRRTTRPADRGA